MQKYLNADSKDKAVLDLGCPLTVFLFSLRKTRLIPAFQKGRGGPEMSRTFLTIINTLIEAEFVIEKLIEPVPTSEMAEAHPEYKDLFHKPDFLLIRAGKAV